MTALYKAVAVLLLLSLIQMPSLAMKRALVVGIGRYASQPMLNSPVNDARAVTDLLKGWYGFPSRDVVVLLDERATRANIEREIRKFRNADAGDVIAIYFSGHGTMTYLNGCIVEALVPYDGDPNRAVTVIPTRLLHEWLEKIPARQVDLILDCCYSGRFTKEPAAPKPKCVFATNIPDDAIKTMEKTLVVSQVGHAVVSASQTKEEVLDTEFPLTDGTRLRISALTFLMYRQLYVSPSISHKALIERVQRSMADWMLDQKPGVAGLIGSRRIFGGPANGIHSGMIPLLARRSGGAEAMGGSGLGLRAGLHVCCFDSRGKRLGETRVSRVNWQRSWLTVMPADARVLAVELDKN